MSLRHALLGILHATPMTGYDLVQYFQRLVASVWSAPQSQIYPELRRLEAAGLVRAMVAPRGQRATKRIYSLTDAGLQELKRWAAELTPVPAERDPIRLKSLFSDLAPLEAVREQFRAHIAHYQPRLELWQERADAIRGARAPHVVKILEQRPAEEHERIIQLKAHAVEGLVARARTEIAWARRGLALIDELEARRLDRVQEEHANGSPESGGGLDGMPVAEARRARPARAAQSRLV